MKACLTRTLLWIGIVLVLASSCPSAPLPRAKPATPKTISLVGDWEMDWNGTTRAPTTLADGGGYACYWHGQWWQGLWRLDGQRLTVTEQPLGSTDGTSVTWSATLEPGKVVGKMEGGGVFALHRLPQKK